MKLKWKYFLSIIIVCVLFFSACEIKAPIIPSNGAILHQKPKPPKNLVATSGYKDTITLSWDPVENTGLYKIYGSEASDFGSLKLMGTSTTNKFVINKNSTPSVSIDPNQSYIFTVRAVTFFDNTSEYLESLNSNYAEGTLAPEKLSLHAVVTDNYVDTYWNSSNLFSAWNSSHIPEMLYKAKFKLSYRKVGSNESESVVIDKNVEDSLLPWLYERIDINEAGMKQDTSYSFEITMEIFDSENTLITTVKSDDIAIEISSSKITTPISKEDIIVSTDFYDKINIKWSVPLWTEGVSMENSYFKIERSVEGQDAWEVLVDEISEKKDSEDITLIGYDAQQRMIVSFDDKTAALGENYVYRITNAAEDSYGTIYQHEAEKLEISSAGCKYLPETPSFNSTAVSNNPIKSTITFNVSNIELKDNRLSYGVYREIYHNDSIESALLQKFETTSFEHVELLNCQSCLENKEHTYKYSFVLLGQNDEIIKNYGYFTFDGSDSITLAPDGIIIANTLEASSDRVDVALTWKEYVFDEELSQSLRYYYSLDGSAESQEFTPTIVSTTEDYVEKAYLIDIIDRDVKTIEIFATTTDNAYETELSIEAKILQPLVVNCNGYSLEDDTFTFTWDATSFPSDLVYTFDYSINGSNQWTSSNLNIVASEGKTAFVVKAKDLKLTPNEKYQFRISYHRGTYESDGVVYTNLYQGYVEVPLLDLNIQSGVYADKTTLTWTDPFGHSIYKFYFYDGNDLKSAEPINKEIGPDNSLEVDNIPEGKRFIAYSLNLEENGITYYSPIAANSSQIIDKYGDAYRKDQFIPFDTITAPTLKVEEAPLMDNMYSPYLIFTWDRVYGASSYDLTVIGDEDKILSETLTINVDELLHNQKLSESGTANTVGYLTYDKSTHQYTYLTDMGTLRRSLAFKDFKVIGHNADKSVATKENSYSSTAELFRAFKPNEIVNFVNNILSKELAKANDQFRGDWWPGTVIKNMQYKYPNDSATDITIATAYGGRNYPSQSTSPGYIKFSNYSESLYQKFIFTTNEPIRLWVPSGASGYLNDDPLETVGKDEVGLLNISFDKMPQISLKYKNVNKDNKNGSYDVTINGTTTNVSDSDSLVSVFEGF